MLSYNQKTRAVLIGSRKRSVAFVFIIVIHALQGLYDLKNHEGWTVSRDDDLQVMYRHLAGLQTADAFSGYCPMLRVLFALPSSICSVLSQAMRQSYAFRIVHACASHDLPYTCNTRKSFPPESAQTLSWHVVIRTNSLSSTFKSMLHGLQAHLYTASSSQLISSRRLHIFWR